MKFPHDVPKQRVIHTFLALGFTIIRSGNHISLERLNSDESGSLGHAFFKGKEPDGISKRRKAFYFKIELIFVLSAFFYNKRFKKTYRRCIF